MTTFLCIIVSIVLFIGFVAVESRELQPLVPGRLFRYQDFGGGMLLALVQAAAYAGMTVYASIYWQSVSGLPPLLTGLAFLPSALLMTLAVGPTASGLAQRFGARALSSTGSIVMIAGMGLALYVTTLDPQWWLMLIVTLVGSVGCMETFEMSMIAGLAHVNEADEGVRRRRDQYRKSDWDGTGRCRRGGVRHRTPGRRRRASRVVESARVFRCNAAGFALSYRREEAARRDPASRARRQDCFRSEGRPLTTASLRSRRRADS